MNAGEREPIPNPRGHHLDRREQARVRRDEARSRVDLMSRLRVATFVLGAAAVGLLLASGGPAGSVAGLVVLLFVGLVLLHQRAAARRRRAERVLAHHEAALARIDGRWPGEGVSGETYLDPDHPYALHLDLFGRGSLFELLCTARSASGQETLARWLLQPAAVDELLERQEAVAELRDRAHEREALAELDLPTPGPGAPARLRAWTARPVPTRIAGRRAGLLVLGIAQFATLGMWLLGPWSVTPFFLSSMVTVALTRRLGASVDASLAAAEGPVVELRLLASLLRSMEDAPARSARLRALVEAVRSRRGVVASRRIDVLAAALERADLARNPFFAPFALLVLWRAQWAFAVESWRRDHGDELECWSAAVGEWEALHALATFAFEHPEDVRPRFVEGGPMLVARELAHPLLPEEQAVRNEVELGAEQQLWIVSGSNMSGKSTLLRSVGCNVVLALCGSTVRAHGMILSPLRVAASLRTQDSLLDGRSRFQAEVEALRRVRAATESADGGQALFLLDELFSGTNSHDRRVGARALLRALLSSGALGMVTTHDLALTELETDLPGTVRNVHFTDEVEDGELHFDYRLREGVVRHSNALEVLRKAGLFAGEAEGGASRS